MVAIGSTSPPIISPIGLGRSLATGMGSNSLLCSRAGSQVDFCSYSVISRKKQRLDCSTLSQHTDDDAPGTLLFPQEDHDLASQRNTEVDDELTSSCTSSIWRATESTLMDDIPSLDTGLIMPDMDMTFNHSSPPLNEGVNIECEDRHNEQLQDTAMFDAFAGIMNVSPPRDILDADTHKNSDSDTVCTDPKCYTADRGQPQSFKIRTYNTDSRERRHADERRGSRHPDESPRSNNDTD